LWYKNYLDGISGTNGILHEEILGKCNMEIIVGKVDYVKFSNL
jgi:hypothetical protein